MPKTTANWALIEDKHLFHFTHANRSIGILLFRARAKFICLLSQTAAGHVTSLWKWEWVERALPTVAKQHSFLLIPKSAWVFPNRQVKLNTEKQNISQNKSRSNLLYKHMFSHTSLLRRSDSLHLQPTPESANTLHSYAKLCTRTSKWHLPSPIVENIYIYIYVCVCVHIYMYIYTHTYTCSAAQALCTHEIYLCVQKS